MRWFFIVVLLMTACGQDDFPLVDSDCDTEQVARNLEEIAERWDDAFDVASSTSRIAMAGPISDMQTIRRETRNQVWPECAQKAQQELVGWMDESIDAFTAFMAQEDDDTVKRHIERGQRHRDRFISALNDLRE